MSRVSYFIDWDSVPERFGISGIPINLINGEFLQLSRVELPPGFQNQAHDPPSEQFGIVLAGVIEYDIEGTVIRCHAGDCYLIPAKKRHAIKVVSDESARLLKCFGPPREEYR